MTDNGFTYEDKVAALKKLVREAVTELMTPESAIDPFNAGFPTYGSLSRLLESLRNSEALYVLDKELNG